MLLSSIYPLGVYFQGVEGTALTRGRTWSPRSGTPPGSVMNASSMSTSATCIASTAPTPGAGGQVRISVHRQGASTTLIHVANDGEGIPPGQLGHIFERFYRGGGCPQSGQRRGRYRSDHLQGIERGPQRHSHHHLLRARSRSGVYPPSPAAPSRQ